MDELYHIIILVQISGPKIYIYIYNSTDTHNEVLLQTMFKQSSHQLQN